MKKHFSVFHILAIVAILAPAARLAAQSNQQTALIEGAKKEGKLVWYTSMAIDLSKPLLDAFTKEHPFIKGDLVRAGNEQLTNRIFNETRAGKWGFDLISLSSADLFVERGLFAPYNSPEREAFIPEFKEPRGYWTSVYNSNLAFWNMGPNDFQTMQIGSSPAMMAALEKGGIDAAVLTEPTFFFAEDQGYRVNAGLGGMGIYYL